MTSTLRHEDIFDIIRGIDNRLGALERSLGLAGFAEPIWLTGFWSYASELYSGSPPVFPTAITPVGYARDRLGYIHLRGIVRLKAPNINWSVPMFILPEGFRPEGSIFPTVTYRDSSSGVQYKTTTIVISNDGSVQIAGTILPPENDWLSLDGIVFPSSGAGL